MYSLNGLLVLRQIKRRLWTTAIVILSVAISATWLLSLKIVRSQIFEQPLPIDEPNSLIAIAPVRAGSATSSAYPDMLSASQFLDLTQDRTVLASAAGWHDSLTDIGIDNTYHKGEVMSVTSDFFQTVGIKTQIGRPLMSADFYGAGTSGKLVAVISDRTWKDDFASDPTIVHRHIMLGKVEYEIVGVLTPPFSGLRVGVLNEAIIPFSPGHSLQDPSMWVLARPNRRLSVNQVAKALQAKWQIINRQSPLPRLSALDGSANNRVMITVSKAGTGFAQIRERYDKPLMGLAVLAALLLIIAYANSMSVLLGRAVEKLPDAAVKDALGQPILSKILEAAGEPLIIVSSAHVLGLACACALSRSMVSSMWTGAFPLFMESSIFHLPIFLITVLTIGATTLLLIPSLVAGLTSRGNQISTHGNRSLGGGRRAKTLFRLFLCMQIALSLTVGAVAIRVTRQFLTLTQRHLGFVPGPVETYWLTPSPVTNRGPSSGDCLNLLQAVDNIPGVASAALSNSWPVTAAADLTRVTTTSPMRVEGAFAEESYVSPNFFRTMGIPLLWGRGFTESESSKSPGLGPAVISEGLARSLFGEQNALGEMISVAGQPMRLVVIGIVGEASISNPYTSRNGSIYLPLLAEPSQWYMPVLHVKFNGGDRNNGVVDVLHAIRSSKTYYSWRQRHLAYEVDNTLAQLRLVVRLSTLCSCASVLLAIFGLYGASKYVAVSDTKADALRIAFGCTHRSLIGSKILQTLPPMAIGLCIGTLSYLSVCRFFVAPAADHRIGGNIIDIAAMAFVLVIAIICVTLAVIFQYKNRDIVSLLRS